MEMDRGNNHCLLEKMLTKRLLNCTILVQTNKIRRSAICSTFSRNWSVLKHSNAYPITGCRMHEYVFIKNDDYIAPKQNANQT